MEKTSLLQVDNIEDIDKSSILISDLRDFFLTRANSKLDKDLSPEQIVESYFHRAELSDLLSWNKEFYEHDAWIMVIVYSTKNNIIKVLWVFMWLVFDFEWENSYWFQGFYRLVDSRYRKRWIMKQMQKNMEEIVKRKGVQKMLSTPYIDNPICINSLLSFWYEKLYIYEGQQYMIKTIA